ncbi:MAG: sensor histidine kinase [Oscillospiraceae bacterium]
MRKKKSKGGGIRKRWILNSISVVVVLVLIAVSAFSIAISSYYYTSMSAGLESTVKAATSFLENYTESEYRAYVSRYVSAFESKDKLELQFLNRYGSVQESTSGLTAGISPGTPDITDAINNHRTQPWTGKDPNTGERIMAVSAPVIYNGTVVGVMRVVTSLRLVDKQIITTILLALLIGCAVLAIVYFSNLYFVRSIVEPVAGITEIAKRIAAGSYGIQMEKKNDDEIGDLTDAINDMSLKIAQSEKTQSEFISSVSHELRTPLTAINGWAETIMNGEVRSAEDVKKGMGIIVSEARRLTNMVEELLEFSRIEDGRFTLSVEEMDLKAELEDAVYTYREFFRREGTTLNYDDGNEELPSVTGDPERMRQVFCNLLDNAFKHGGAGKRIDVAVRREEDSAVITIRDYGPGIPEDELPHVKYKFYKGSSKARGSGIGLAVCDEIITRHNGTLDIGNAEGGGCIVTIRLPIDITAGNGT